jgi:hypothetical protein
VGRDQLDAALSVTTVAAGRLDVGEWHLSFQGPGGFATPDDVEGLEGCQMAFATRKEVEWSDISRGMKGNLAGGPGELQMRVFWRSGLPPQISCNARADRNRLRSSPPYRIGPARWVSLRNVN